MARGEAELIPLREAAKISGLSHSHLRLLARESKIWAKKVGPIWVTTAQAVKEYIRQDIRPGRKGKRSVTR